MSEALAHAGRGCGPVAGLCGAGALLALAGCAEAPAPEAAGDGPAGTQVVDQTGAGTAAPTFTVRRQGRLVKVDFLHAGPGAYRVVTTSRSGRGLDRADARTAYDAAFEAAQNIDCGGRPMMVVADSATYQEEDRRSALTQGAPAWTFLGRCG